MGLSFHPLLSTFSLTEICGFPAAAEFTIQAMIKKVVNVIDSGGAFDVRKVEGSATTEWVCGQAAPLSI